MMMKSTRRGSWLLLPLLAAAPSLHAQSVAGLPPATSIVARYAEAVGAPAILAAGSIVTKGSMQMPAAGFNASFEMVQLAPNKTSMVTEIPGLGKIEVGFDGTTGWSMDPMQGARLLDGKQLAQVTDDSDRRAMIRSAEMFTSLETVADTTMNGERCYLVKLAWKSGRESTECYSAASGLIVASQSVQSTPMGDIPVTALLHDYRKFGDVTVPTRTVQEASGMQQILTIVSVEIGDGSNLSITPPPAVQALIDQAK